MPFTSMITSVKYTSRFCCLAMPESVSPGWTSTTTLSGDGLLEKKSSLLIASSILRISSRAGPSGAGRMSLVSIARASDFLPS